VGLFEPQSALTSVSSILVGEKVENLIMGTLLKI